MKLFLDTSNTCEVQKHFGTGLIDGVTTVYSNIIKAGRNPKDVYRELLLMGIPHISAELMGTAPEIVKNAMDLTDEFGTGLTIKVPCTRDGLAACRELKKDNPDRTINVTLVFSAAQSIMASKSGADFVSVPVGMLDSNSIAGLEVVRSVVALCANTKTQVIADDIHDVYKVTRGFYNGADIVSMPPLIFEKMFEHVLTHEGVDTFDRDLL